MDSVKTTGIIHHISVGSITDSDKMCQTQRYVLLLNDSCNISVNHRTAKRVLWLNKDKVQYIHNSLGLLDCFTVPTVSQSQPSAHIWSNWSRQPRVFQRLPPLLCLSDNNMKTYLTMLSWIWGILSKVWASDSSNSKLLFSGKLNGVSLSANSDSCEID